MNNIIEPKYSPSQQQNNWMNLIHGTHDQFCGCEDTISHLLLAISKDNPKQLSRQQIKEIKWRLTGETTTETDGDAVDALDIGDLEALFAGDEDTLDTPSG